MPSDPSMCHEASLIYTALHAVVNVGFGAHKHMVEGDEKGEEGLF